MCVLHLRAHTRMKKELICGVRDPGESFLAFLDLGSAEPGGCAWALRLAEEPLPLPPAPAPALLALRGTVDLSVVAAAADDAGVAGSSAERLRTGVCANGAAPPASAAATASAAGADSDALALLLSAGACTSGRCGVCGCACAGAALAALASLAGALLSAEAAAAAAAAVDLDFVKKEDSRCCVS